jgi:peptidoglycan hydrolase-like protein with peptidoglycan-binding domain
MFRNLVVGLTAIWMAATGLPALAQQDAPPPAELVREIQSRLFDLNYQVWVDGNWDERTRAAVKEWHRITGLPNPEAMSDGDMAYLRTAPPVKVWGGLVYDALGHYRLFTNGTSRQKLVEEELGYCKDNLDAKACALNTVLGMNFADQQCVAVAHGDWKDAGGSQSTTHASKRPNVKSASDNAMGTCGKEAGADNCKLVAAVCADGSSQIGQLERKR